MTIIQDMINGRYVQGKYLPKLGNLAKRWDVIDSDDKVYRIYQNITVKTDRGLRVTGWDLSFDAPDTPNGGNGRYIQYQKYATAIAPMDSAHGILVSGEYSGCAFEVLKCQTHNMIYAAHVYRGAPNPDECSNLFDHFKNYMHWTTLMSMSTRGITKILGTNQGCFVAERAGGAVSVVLLHISGAGGIVDVTTCGSHDL